MTARSYVKHGTWDGVSPEVKKIWYSRDDEPEFLPDEQVHDTPEESDDMRHLCAKQSANELLSRLPKKYARVLALHYLHDMSFPEIARVMGLSVGYVQQLEQKIKDRASWYRDQEPFKSVGLFFS